MPNESLKLVARRCIAKQCRSSSTPDHYLLRIWRIRDAGDRTGRRAELAHVSTGRIPYYATDSGARRQDQLLIRGKFSRFNGIGITLKYSYR